jgi:hypothetical protein
MIRYAIIAGVIYVLIAPASLFASVPQGLDCYLVQMHIHAHTNHNGNDLPASMEWHCAQAETHGFDVIWWSEHSEVFDTYEDMRISFRDAYFNKVTGSVDLVRTRSRRRLSKLNLEGAVQLCSINTRGPDLEIEVASRGAGEFESVKVVPASERGPVKTVSWCRPVTSGLRVEALVDVQGLGEDAFLRFGFDLAAHPEGRHHLVFEIVGGEVLEHEVIGDTLVVTRMGVGGFPSRLDFDLERAASHLDDGYDNTLGSMYMELGVREGATVKVAVDSLILISDRPWGENQHRVILQLAERYECRHDITQYMGVEASGIHTPERPHMNAFLPESTETLANLVIDPAVERKAWAAGIGGLGGLVSLNHPFGAALDPTVRGVYDAGTAGSLLDMAGAAGPMSEEDLWAVARPIIETGGMGCGILEVGYIFRGTGSLADHLRLWDLVLAHGVRMVGNGVSDAHGGIWGSELRPNPFATWIWARGKDRESLLESLRAGRVCFGEPFAFKSHLAFGVEDAFMGDTLYVERGEEVEGWVEIKPWVEDLDIRLVQVRIGDGPEPVYLARSSLRDPAGGFGIEVRQPCFARVEVYAADGRPLVFSNPVWLIPDDGVD